MSLLVLLAMVFASKLSIGRLAALGFLGAVGTWGEPACLLLALAGFGLQAAIIFALRIATLHRLPVPVI